MQDQEQLIDPIKEFAKSPEIFVICEDIGKKFGLHIDQMGELDSEIRGILMGSRKSENFLQDIMTRLEVDRDMAKKITEETNQQIFKILRAKIQSQTSTPQPAPVMVKSQIPEPVRPPSPPVQPSPHADLEKAGNFTIMGESNHQAEIPQTKPDLVQEPATENKPASFDIHSYYNFGGNEAEPEKSEGEESEETTETEAENDTSDNIAETENDSEEKEEILENKATNLEEKAEEVNFHIEEALKQMKKDPVPAEVPQDKAEPEDQPAVKNTPEPILEKPITEQPNITPENIKKPEVPINLPTEETVTNPPEIKIEPEKPEITAPSIEIPISKPVPEPIIAKPPPVQVPETKKAVKQEPTQSKPRTFDPYREPIE